MIKILFTCYGSISAWDDRRPLAAEMRQIGAGEAEESGGSLCIIPINTKYYSDSVAIVPITEYNAITGSEVQNYVYISKTGRRKVGDFRQKSTNLVLRRKNPGSYP